MFGRTADHLIARFGWRRGLRLFGQLKLAKLLPAGTRVRVDVPILKAAVHLRARATDALVLKQLLLKGDFDFEVPVPPRFIIDAGANVGLISAHFATRFPEARIVALEIDAGNFAQLLENVRPYPNVIPLHAGLWSHATELVVANPEASAWAFRAKESPKGAAPSTAIPAHSVTDLMRQFGARQVDVLKIDIEGGEREVFGPSAEDWVDRVALIAVELHDRLVRGCEEAVTSRLRGRFTRSRSGEFDIFVRTDPS